MARAGVANGLAAVPGPRSSPAGETWKTFPCAGNPSNIPEASRHKLQRQCSSRFMRAWTNLVPGNSLPLGSNSIQKGLMVGELMAEQFNVQGSRFKVQRRGSPGAGLPLFPHSAIRNPQSALERGAGRGGILGWNFAANSSCYGFLYVLYYTKMHIRANGGRKGCPGRGAGLEFRLQAVGPGTVGIRGRHRLKAELQTGKATLGGAAKPRPWPAEGGFCGLCLSKGLEESRIESGVKRFSQNRSSGRESALNFPKKSEPTHVGCYGKWGLATRFPGVSLADSLNPRLPSVIPPGCPKSQVPAHLANSVRKVAKWRWLCGLAKEL